MSFAVSARDTVSVGLIGLALGACGQPAATGEEDGAAASAPTEAVEKQTTDTWTYSPYVGRAYPQSVYFGDTHLHTSTSLDAYGDGNTKIGPDEAYRFAKGETPEAHAGRIAELWAGFNEVARSNPHAWIRRPYTAQEIGQASPDNPMISYPYTRLMNANARVDMAAGLILCSLTVAREAGVPEQKLVYLHAATEANDSTYASERADFHRSPAMRIAGGRALELAGRTPAEIEHVDLYSCFPAAVQLAAVEPAERGGRGAGYAESRFDLLRGSLFSTHLTGSSRRKAGAVTWYRMMSFFSGSS